jgi:benzoyl-CoA reductase/2-hydroxyglutaryl-CoA dehydratase subunit BcrC/BadD/HgdB
MRSDLKTLEKIKEALEKRPAELLEEKKAGKKIAGWVNYNVPEELLYALDFIPIRLGLGGDDRLVDIGARYISTKNCVFVRELVGLFEEKADPYIQAVDFVALDATCLQIYRVAELIKYYFKVNTVILGVPRNFATEAGRIYFRQETAHFAHKLEELAGKKLTTEKLAAAIELYNQIRSAIQELYKFQAGNNPKIGWLDTLDVVQAGNFLDKKQFLLLLLELIAELREKQGEPVFKNLYDDVRIFLSGSIIPPRDRKLISIIESQGGRIVGDDLWSGLLPSIQVDIQAPTVEAIADAYLGRAPHAALPYLDLASDGRLKNLKKLVGDFKAHAVIYHTLRYCDPFTFKGNETKTVVNKEGIPFLEIHTEYAGSDYEAIRTRVEAFVELLKNKNLVEV